MIDRTRVPWLGVLVGMAVTALILAACGAPSSTSSTPATSSTAGSTLPRNVVVPLNTVTHYFPELTQQASTGPNAGSVGRPVGTRAVVFTSKDGSKKVTLSVDQYRNSGDAIAAYRRAVKGSQAAPGAKPASRPDLGQESFAGTSQVGTEMHFGLGTVDGRIIVAATYAGYPVTTDNSTKLVALGSQELSTAEKILG